MKNKVNDKTHYKTGEILICVISPDGRNDNILMNQSFPEFVDQSSAKRPVFIFLFSESFRGFRGKKVFMFLLQRHSDL